MNEFDPFLWPWCSCASLQGRANLPSQFIPIHTIPCYSIRIHLISHLLLGFRPGFIPSGFPTKILYAFLFFTYVPYALPISSSLIPLSTYCFMGSSVLPIFVLVSLSLSLSLSLSQTEMSFSATYSLEVKLNFGHSKQDNKCMHWD